MGYNQQSQECEKYYKLHHPLSSMNKWHEKSEPVANERLKEVLKKLGKI